MSELLTEFHVLRQLEKVSFEEEMVRRYVKDIHQAAPSFPELREALHAILRNAHVMESPSPLIRRGCSLEIQR